MPYSKKLIESRKHAAQAGSNLRAVLRDVEKQAFYPPHRQKVVSAIQAALKVLYDYVDYDDDGSVLGIVGEYEAGQQGEEAIALPARMPEGNITEPHHPWSPGVREGWNKCLDELAKSGHLYTRPQHLQEVAEQLKTNHRLHAARLIDEKGRLNDELGALKVKLEQTVMLRYYIERDTGAPVKSGKVRDLVYSLSRAKSNDVEGIEFLVHTTNLNDAISLLEQLADKLE